MGIPHGKQRSLDVDGKVKNRPGNELLQVSVAPVHPRRGGGYLPQFRRGTTPMDPNKSREKRCYSDFPGHEVGLRRSIDNAAWLNTVTYHVDFGYFPGELLIKVLVGSGTGR